MKIKVVLHTVLQQQAARENQGLIDLTLPEHATVGDAISVLHITLPPDALILVANHRVVDVQYELKEGDLVDLIPAISGG